jgi:signal transduction histidine kinase
MTHLKIYDKVKGNKMLKKILKNKIIISIVSVSVVVLISLFITIPQLTEKNTIELIKDNSIDTVEQIKLTREYYLKNVVKDIKEFAPNIKFDYAHKGVNGVLPFPTTTIHDLSHIFSANTHTQFRFYSEYPFKPKLGTPLDAKQKEILEYTKKNTDGIYVGLDTIDGKPVVRVAVTDFMTDQSCVDCHNAHPDRTWEKDWKLGDRRGVLEVITPLEEAYKANNVLKLKILGLIGAGFLLLIIYYSIVLYKRENELLDENDKLDARIKDEVAKNLQKEKQIILQNRSAALGDMMAAIIHQWKQPLNGISMANSSLKLQTGIGVLDLDEVLKQTENIELQIENMNLTMNDFRDFFKPKQITCYDVNLAIEQVYRIVGKIYENQNIHLILDLEENCFTSGYSNELNQVIINILNNARDQILSVQCDIKNIVVKTTRNKEEHTVAIQIHDYAGGIDETIIGTIFEPYVTTKDDNHGTGIGLDMSKTIIEKVGGTISAQNNIYEINGKDYKGACFTITLESCKTC